MTAATYLASACVSMCTATCQRSAQTIVGRLDSRLACIELIGWPALEDSLRRELAEAMAIARDRGFRVQINSRAPPVVKQKPGKRTVTCGVCEYATTRLGSTRRMHQGRFILLCPKCAGFL